MRKSKKFIIIAVLAAIVLVGSLAGVALAQTDTDGSALSKTLLGRVATILGIDQQKVEDAFTQARNEIREETLDNHLKNLVERGSITQEQADQYKAWLELKPDMAPFQRQLKDWQQARPEIPSELKSWLQARPDIPIPDGFGNRGFRMPKGFGGIGFLRPGVPGFFGSGDPGRPLPPAG